MLGKVCSGIFVLSLGMSPLLASDQDEVALFGYRKKNDKKQRKEEVQMEHECPKGEDCCEMQGAMRRAVTPSARGCMRDGAYTFVDFLYWSSEEDRCVIYAFNNTAETVEDGNIVTVETDFDPGVRLGFGGNLPYDGWDVTGYWTYFRNKRSDSINVPTNNQSQGLNTIWLPQNTGNVESASAAMKLTYNALDFELGRSFFVSGGLSFRPYTSLEVIWMDRKLDVSYGPADGGTLLSGSYAGNSDYWGIGPRVGSIAKWYVGYGLSLLSNFSLSILYGKHDADESATQDNSGTIITSRISSDDCWNTVPHLQVFVGLSWERCFACDRFYLNSFMGWEANEFWGLESFLLSNGPAASIFSVAEKIGFKGLTWRVQFDY